MPLRVGRAVSLTQAAALLLPLLLLLLPLLTTLGTAAAAAATTTAAAAASDGVAGVAAGGVATADAALDAAVRASCDGGGSTSGPHFRSLSASLRAWVSDDALLAHEAHEVVLASKTWNWTDTAGSSARGGASAKVAVPAAELPALAARVAALLSLPASAAPDTLHFSLMAPGAYHAAHVDTNGVGDATVVLYFQTVDAGIHFPHANATVRPAPGRAVVFMNRFASGAVDSAAVHGAEPYAGDDVVHRLNLAVSARIANREDRAKHAAWFDNPTAHRGFLAAESAASVTWSRAGGGDCPQSATACLKDGRNKAQCETIFGCTFLSRFAEPWHAQILKMSPDQKKVCEIEQLGCHPNVGCLEWCNFACEDLCSVAQGCTWNGAQTPKCQEG